MPCPVASDTYVHLELARTVFPGNGSGWGQGIWLLSEPVKGLTFLLSLVTCCPLSPSPGLRELLPRKNQGLNTFLIFGIMANIFIILIIFLFK